MDIKLYEKAKQIVNKQYGSKTTAYRSMAIVKKYKELGGKYKTKKNDNEGVSRWLNEKWIKVRQYLENGSRVKCGSANRRAHACRPSIRVSDKTPITIQEVVHKHGHKKVLELALKKKNSDAYRVNWKMGKFTAIKKTG
jgi:hypothetical protein